MVKKSGRPLPPGINILGANIAEAGRNYIDINISNADNGYILSAHSNMSNIKQVFTSKDELLKAVEAYLDASPEDEEED